MSVQAHHLSKAEPTPLAKAAGYPLPDIAEVWRHTLGDPGVCIAVLDGPVDLSHPSLRGARLKMLGAPGKSGCLAAACIHGTHVASVIFGQHGDGRVKGIAPKCRGIAIPVFSDDPAYPGAIRPCSQGDLARAIEAAVGYGARVINVSAGQPGHAGTADPRLRSAVELCARRGVLIVAAAGNDGCDCLHLPAALPTVLTVGAHGVDGAPSESSNFGSAYQRQGVVAPGLSVLGATPGGRYARHSGTSFAAPLVAGLAGLLFSAKLSRRGSIAVSDARAVHEALLRSASPCDLNDRRECRRLLAGRVVPLRAFELYLKGAVDMDQLAKTSPSQLAAGGIAVTELPEGAAPAGSVRPSGSCGCSTPVSEQPGLGARGSESEENDDENTEASGGRQGASLSRPLPAASSRGVAPSECGCQPKGGLVFAIGELSYDFGTQARLDAIQGEMEPGKFATVPRDLLNFLKNTPSDTEAEEELASEKKGGPRRRGRTPPEAGPPAPGLSESPNLHFATAMLWTLNLDATPIYAMRPAGAFARETYIRLVESFEDQINEKSERLSVPGVLDGNVTLLSGQSVPVLVPDLRALFNWRTAELVRAVIGERPSEKAGVQKYDEELQDMRNFLDRVYYEMQNTGQTPQERALNFAATNAFNIARIMERAATSKQQLDEISVERSPVCRPDSDCWDVRLTFFDATNFLAARSVFKFTVDVSDVVPVLVGPFRSWSMR